MSERPTSKQMTQAEVDAIPQEIHDQAIAFEIEFSPQESPSAERYAEFQQWLDADKRHRAAYQYWDSRAAVYENIGVELGLRTLPKQS